ncbi:MAG: phosphoribosylformylglycinamidine cyclo-ligase [Synergistaceae bacterium]|jgi:phosphoribosylformylglycinamidine cyclo-ligase|nr:phosphoribosylformylglycinamidine cyclo-ligase [Synergistaceae bacterium]
MSSGSEKRSVSYRDAGVDVDAGNRAVEEIREAVRSTYRPEVVGDIGGFGGLFSFAAAREKYRDPILVSGTDGVGTKLKVAFMANRHDTVGIDAVAMCVNDVLAQGAEPLFFLDYLAVGKLAPLQVKEIVSGVAAGCRESGCALIGGETAEMPGFYAPGEYDIAGFCVGVAERDALLPRGVGPGDALVGLPSSGLHSNGFSLVRKIFFDMAGMKVSDFVPALSSTLGDALLEPTRLYPRVVLPLLQGGHGQAKDRLGRVKGVVHVTGGGFRDNIPRALPPGSGARVRLGTWPVPEVFRLIQRLGDVPDPEMYAVFNMGIGMILITDDADAVINDLASRGERAFAIGEVIRGTGVEMN